MPTPEAPSLAFNHSSTGSVLGAAQEQGQEVFISDSPPQLFLKGEGEGFHVFSPL